MQGLTTKWGAIIGILAGVALVAAGLGALRTGVRGEPGTEDWRAARDLVRQGFEAGDGVRLEPWWQRDAVQVFGESGGPDVEIDSSFPPDPLYVARHRRLWVVSAPGHGEDPPPVEGLTELRKEPVAGGVTVRRFDAPPSPILVDLTTRLHLATVERWWGTGSRRRCTWDSRSHDCGGRRAENVAIETVEAGGSPRRCIVVRPSPGTGSVSLAWAHVKLGSSLVLRSGFTATSARAESVSDARISALIDGREVASGLLSAGEWRWTPSRVATEPGRVADVALEVSATANPAPELCLDLLLMD